MHAWLTEVPDVEIWANEFGFLAKHSTQEIAMVVRFVREGIRKFPWNPWMTQRSFENKFKN